MTSERQTIGKFCLLRQKFSLLLSCAFEDGVGIYRLAKSTLTFVFPLRR